MRHQESIWEQEQRLKEEAKKLAEQNKDKPVTKYRYLAWRGWEKISPNF